jgi:hypothetical protein
MVGGAATGGEAGTEAGFKFNCESAALILLLVVQLGALTESLKRKLTFEAALTLRRMRLVLEETNTSCEVMFACPLDPLSRREPGKSVASITVPFGTGGAGGGGGVGGGVGVDGVGGDGKLQICQVDFVQLLQLLQLAQEQLRGLPAPPGHTQNGGFIVKHDGAAEPILGLYEVTAIDPTSTAL